MSRIWKIEGMNWNWASGADFGNWLQQVLNILKPKFPEAKWGYPGLSPQPNVDAFLDGSAAAANACDWIGVHCYWQQPPHQPPFPIDGDNAGMYWRAKFKPRFPDKMLMITEFSNNSAGVSPTEKARNMRITSRLLRTEPNIGAAFGFALNWPGQDNNHEGWEGSAIPGAFVARAGTRRARLARAGAVRRVRRSVTSPQRRHASRHATSATPLLRTPNVLRRGEYLASPAARARYASRTRM